MAIKAKKKLINSEVIKFVNAPAYDEHGVSYQKLYLEQKRKLNDLVDKFPQLVKKVLRDAKQSGKLNLKNCTSSALFRYNFVLQPEALRIN